jgi:hypothetical protein
MYDERQDAKAKVLGTYREIYQSDPERREERVSMLAHKLDYKRLEAVRVMRARGMFQEPRRRDDADGR